MKFSICIPNYNYERYLGRTLRSVLDQTDRDFEVLVSDNASTDGSVAVVKSIADPRIKLHINACNVGFAGNLDRAGHMASGERMIMLSSDDLMRPEALAAYRSLFDALGPAGERSIVSSSWDVIDSDDHITGEHLPDPLLWKEADRAPHLDAAAGGIVYEVVAHDLLRRCLVSMRSPFNFAATCYPRALYTSVEGYGGGRTINPDKWFHWKILAQADRAYFVDRKLFAYRWHGENQAALENSASALKFLVDEYVSTLELDSRLLTQLSLSRDDVVRGFVEYDIARHGLATLARGQRTRARRVLRFGQAVYPRFVRKNRKAWVLRSLLALGPLGRQIARKAYATHLEKSRIAQKNPVL